MIEDNPPMSEKFKKRLGIGAKSKPGARNTRQYDGLLDLPRHSEEALALAFTDANKHRVRYVAAWNSWLLFDEKVWEKDKLLIVKSLIREICRQSAIRSQNKAEASNKTVNAVETLARADQRTAAAAEVWDADPWLLNTPDGVVDLRVGGAPRPATAEDYMTKITAVGPDKEGKCNEWRVKVVERATGGNAPFMEYLQRFAGYLLTGSIREEEFYFFHGPGAGGKSKFLGALFGVMEDYASAVNAETFTVQAHEGHTTDLARLQSTRFALMSETEQGRRWAEAKLKRVTGGGTITARYMRQDNFEFFPKFKVVVEGNHKPKLWSVDEAIRRRLRLVPFDIVIPEKERDTEIAEKLKKEWPGILRWMIEGCLKWQRDGLKMPEVVRCATEVYLKEQDVFAQWIAMECEVAARERMPAPAGYDSWKSYALAGKEWPGKRHEFKEKMEKAGFSWGHFRDGDYFSGIKLKDKTKGSGYVFVREDEWNKMKEEANKGQ